MVRLFVTIRVKSVAPLRSWVLRVRPDRIHMDTAVQLYTSMGLQTVPADGSLNTYSITGNEAGWVEKSHPVRVSGPIRIPRV